MRDSLKGMVYSLPVILAKNPHDKLSPDYPFFTGCNHLFKHHYEKALESFDLTLIHGLSQQSVDMLRFNRAYCYYKLGKY